MKLRRDIFQAIADPTRRSILLLLASQTLTAGAIANNFNNARSTISKHIQILTESGILESNQQGREIYYRIKINKVDEIEEWLNQLNSVWEDRFDNLEKYLEKIQKDKYLKMKSAENIKLPSDKEDIFVISHTYAADLKVLYKMWIDPVLYTSWMGPAGAEMFFTSVDVREGGTSQWTMTTPDGLTKYGQLHYKIINPESLLAYSQHFCDKAGNFIKAPFSATYPDSLLTSVNFVQDNDNKITMTVKWEIYGNATATERKTFREMKPFMEKGWGESFDKIEILLKSETK